MENFTERKAPARAGMIRGLNMTTAALVQLWISRAAKPTKRSTMLCRSWSTWNTVPVRMPKAKPAMVSVSPAADRPQVLQKAAEEAGITLGNERDYGIGMFFPTGELNRNQDKKLFEIICKKGLNFLGWRRSAHLPGNFGPQGTFTMPSIWQAFVERPARVKPGIDFDRKLYVARRVFEQSSQDTYVCSLSSRTIVYKGMFLVKELRLFYPDLQSEDYESAIGMVHNRFSTNTAPSWNRAHPNRFILHNGEINTIRGNVDTMLARETIGSTT